MQNRISTDTAQNILLALPVVLKSERVEISDALERVAAQDIYAHTPVPPFDKSPFDGYAFRAEDTEKASHAAPVILSITEEIAAGAVATIDITAGKAAKILTGAPVPPGANTTVKYESTEFTETEVKVFEPVKPNTNIVYAGEDIAAGELILAKGTLISSPVLGLLAGQGISKVEVYVKPTIAIINTGSELIEPGNPRHGGKIYNSNLYVLNGYLNSMGAIPVNFGIVVDDCKEIVNKIESALNTADMVITTGGASVGDYDWAITAAKMLGAQVLFWKTEMKPGGSIMAAVKNNKLILGISGNPGAAILGLMRIGWPYIKKLCGRDDVFLPVIDVLLKKPVKKHSPQLRILRGRLEIEKGQAYFVENDGQGNGIASSFVGCDLLAEIPQGSPPLPVLTMVRAYRV